MAPGSPDATAGEAATILEQRLPAVSRGVLVPHASEADLAEIDAALARARERLAGRAVWHVNVYSIGGVSEALHALLGLMRDAGIDVRWAQLDAGPEFFELCQRLYEDVAGMRREFTEADHRLYEEALAGAADTLRGLVSSGDIVVLYDAATAGLVPALAESGARVIWRCHVGTDSPAARGLGAEDFLSRYLGPAERYLFPFESFVWPGLDQARTAALPASVNPASAKNQELAPEVVEAILDTIGLTEYRSEAMPVFTRLDGSPSRVDSRAGINQESTLPRDAPVVAHVSSWDRLKDPAGVVECFARHCDPAAHLVLAGPAPNERVESPAAAGVRADVREAVAAVDPAVRARVHVVGVPAVDAEENAAVINAIQRRAAVFIRKSLAEGFGLSLAESMWKRTPVVASRIGGISELVEDGVSGILVDDPTDLAAFAAAVNRVLEDPELARSLGEQGHRRVEERFLTPALLARYLELTVLPPP
jgi:trehalose synthase